MFSFSGKSAQNKADIEAEINRATSVEGGFETRITDLETAVGTGGSVAEAIKAAIEALDVTDAAVEKQFVTAVAEADGKIAVYNRLKAGYLLAAKSGGASASLGQGYELEAIAGCTIGGVSTTGGIGTVPGILIGVLVFELLKIITQFLGINPYYNYVVQGLVIVLAVALDIRKYIAKK